LAAKILIVDDDRTLLRFVGNYLEKEGYEVFAVDNGPKALRAFFDARPNLVFLDVMMPGMDGWEVCARLREMADTPIIMLTAKTAETEKLRGFRLGVDDYITKPFSLAELGARARAILSRTVPLGEGEPPLYKVGDLEVDMRRREARLQGKTLDLSPTEFRLLEALASRGGEAVSQEELISEVWGASSTTTPSTLRRYIWFLRQKVEAVPERPDRLQNIRGYGYRLEG
jgi:two-component system OmpR family response regulator